MESFKKSHRINACKCLADIFPRENILLADSSLVVISFLMSQGTDVYMDKDRALRDAIWDGRDDIVRYLVANGANMSTRNDYSLRHAAMNGHMSIVKYLVENGGDVDEALCIAAQCGHDDIVVCLVGMGANIHTRNNYPLHQAAHENHTFIVRYLVEYGAVIDDDVFRSAVENDNDSMLEFLVNNGADIHANNDWAFRYAAEYGKNDVMAYLMLLGREE